MNEFYNFIDIKKAIEIERIKMYVHSLKKFTTFSGPIHVLFVQHFNV